MSELEQRVAYLHGLASGFNLREESKEGQVLADVLDVLDLMAGAISRVETAQADLEEYVESLDEDLAELEEEFYEDDLPTWEVTCPRCGTTIEVDEDDYDDEGRLNLACPECGAPVEHALPDGALSGRDDPLTTARD